LTLGLSATLVGLSGAVAEDSHQVRPADQAAGPAPDLEARRQALLAQLPAEQRQEIGDFAAKIQWLHEFMRASPEFDAGAAVALFLSMILKRVVGARRGPFPARVLASAAAQSRLCRGR